jgi:hypothetical protein
MFIDNDHHEVIGLEEEYEEHERIHLELLRQKPKPSRAITRLLFANIPLAR